MIRQVIHNKRYGWTIYCYYAVDCYYLYEIMDRLREAGCKGEQLRTAYRNLYNCDLDTGLTYANPETKEAVMVTALTSSSTEFFNSLTHEMNHLCMYISEAEGIDTLSEEHAYLLGGLARQIYPKTRKLLCDKCREKIYWVKSQ